MYEKAMIFGAMNSANNNGGEYDPTLDDEIEEKFQ
jgi:hypothetical protein